LIPGDVLKDFERPKMGRPRKRAGEPKKAKKRTSKKVSESRKK
jgi:hypothetical protein